MNQLSMLDETTVNIPVDAPPVEPENYRADRDQCQHPDLHPMSAYQYGCRCVGCRKYRSARRHWDKRRPPVCNATGCDNPRRRVQGARYCEDHATSRYWEPTGLREQRVQEVVCDICGTVERIIRSRKRPFCSHCNDKFAGVIRQAAAHHVQQSRLTAWIKRGTCGICDRPLYLGKSKGGSQGFAIDHDHGCCGVGRNSCGHCVRDLLCAGCNISLGHVEALDRRVGINRVMLYLAGA